MSHFEKIKISAEQRALTPPEFASILIVDDQDFDRDRLVRMCRDFAFTTNVVEACSLNMMRDKLRKDRFDLILLDYHLTDGTGLDGVETIRADCVNDGAAIVMITGTDNSDIAIQALKLGFSDYLTKDELNVETLTRAAITALQKAQLARGIVLRGTQRSAHHQSIEEFSRECAQDIKPIVSRMMRQMRDLRESDDRSPEKISERIDHVQGSMGRLWSFLDDLEKLGGGPVTPEQGPTLKVTKASQVLAQTRIKAMVPVHRPERSKQHTAKPPSIFRRRPD